MINFGGQSSWSNAVDAQVFGRGGITYSLSNGFRATGGSFTFPAASTIEVDVYIGTAAANVDITINATRNSINEWSGSISDAGVGRHTVRMTKQNSGEYVLPNDNGITMTLTASGIITYDILAVRWSDTGDAYRHIGSVEGGPSGPFGAFTLAETQTCLLYTSPSPRDS